MPMSEAAARFTHTIRNISTESFLCEPLEAMKEVRAMSYEICLITHNIFDAISDSREKFMACRTKTVKGAILGHPIE